MARPTVWTRGQGGGSIVLCHVVAVDSRAPGEKLSLHFASGAIVELDDADVASFDAVWTAYTEAPPLEPPVNNWGSIIADAVDLESQALAAGLMPQTAAALVLGQRVWCAFEDTFGTSLARILASIESRRDR